MWCEKWGVTVTGGSSLQWIIHSVTFFLFWDISEKRQIAIPQINYLKLFAEKSPGRNVTYS